MPLELTAVVGISLAVLVVLLALSARDTGRWRGFALELAAIVVFAVFLNRLFDFPFSPPITAKGPDDFVLAGALFICMLFGMVSQFLYRRLEKPQRLRPNWDWGLFIAPVFASPIVFIPLLAAFQNANIDLKDLTAPRLMIFFVAYQNGFFWKEFFDRKQREEGRKKP
jgi:cytochrome bd-type quinol oxidase subunit 2